MKIKIHFFASNILKASLKAVVFILICFGAYFGVTKLLGEQPQSDVFTLALAISGILLYFIEQRKDKIE